MNVSEIKRAIPLICEHTKLTPLVVGKHGIGKSESIRALATELGMDFIDLRLATQDVGDLLGLADFVEDGHGNRVATKFMIPEWFPKAGTKGILFLDEINRARKDVLQAVFQLALDKKLHTTPLPDGWWVVAASNPVTEDYVVTDLEDRAFMDRFAYIKFEPSVSDWTSYMSGRNTSQGIVDFVREMPEHLGLKLGSEFSLDFVQPSPRSMTQLADLYHNIDKADKVLFREIAFGVIGTTASIPLLKFLEENEVRVTGMEVVNNFDAVKDKVVMLHERQRIDVLNAVCDDIIKYSQENDLTADQRANLKQFVLNIPRELTIKTLKGMISGLENIQTFWYDQDLVEYLKPLKGSLAKEAEKESA